MTARLWTTSLALAFTVVAATQGARAEELKAEVIHWWTSGGESAAVKVFAEQFDKAGGTWVDNAIAGGANARTAAINRTVGGNPPTAMQFNTGKQFDELVENDLLRHVDQVATTQNWKSMMPPAILDAVDAQRQDYAVPVNIHGQNWLWYSNAALAKAGAQPPTNWDDVLPGARQAQGGRPDSARVRRPEDLGTQPVQRRAGRQGRQRLCSWRSTASATRPR